MSGKLIVVEGLDGSGKTTQMGLLEEAFHAKNILCRRVKFPAYDQPFSAPVRMYLGGEFGSDPGDVNAYAAATLFAVDRFASFKKIWQKDYQSGTVILTDRYTTSNLTYQLPKLPRSEWDDYLAWLLDFEYGKLGIPKPDLTVFLDMPQELSQKLLDKRYHANGGKRDIHEQNRPYLEACRESAHYAAEKLGWSVIPCSEQGALRSIESIHEDILKTVMAVLDKDKQVSE
ncbi:MAG: Thymidylate kinase [Thermocaproicibacter melissae]|jgi:dTMP kinase|uniref:dTMP kinase n=1 Tax=Thermocaproicibacter melissae TaxID=2966552 RepID=UPI0024B07671|nr:thymidylate kinase [Thermocaproicibacter melissae]WBY64915.1 thymidylate kinase [Thermocaproicibacter melissae]